MDFVKIPASTQPVYTWLWNSTITKEGILEQLTQMYDAGIRGFYVIGEPENFRPHARRTHLSPEYLSDAYLELLYYAYEQGKKMGMKMWLYNEGGFPSGMVCGKIRKLHPELAMKQLQAQTILLPANTPYSPSANILAAFRENTRIQSGYLSQDDTQITEYRCVDDTGSYNANRSDNASRKNTEIFLELTHERLKGRFGGTMGTDVTVMFDDEPYMGTWTEGFEEIFRNRCGYDILDYLPWISGKAVPVTNEQCRAKSDYIMSCGELVRQNYFVPMRQWLNRHGMYSAGHLDRDHDPNACLTQRYGNTMAILREYDIPGVDAIWNQISYDPDETETAQMMPFFPRMASSAARQQGHSNCLSESLAVYGAHVTPELMRYAVNYQAVRGISTFNFMVISYDRKTVMAHQYRPNFIHENPGMDNLSQINEYTARLSHILRESTAEINTALFYPARTICVGGNPGKSAADAFTKLGTELEKAGVAFDIIDEDLVAAGEVRGTSLVCNHVTYDNVFVPVAEFEKPEILQTLSGLGKRIQPCIHRANPAILCRTLRLPSGKIGYFLCNTSAETINDTISVKSNEKLCRVDLFDGTLHAVKQSFIDGNAHLSVSLSRGEGIFLTEQGITSLPELQTETELVTLKNFTSHISRRYRIDSDKGMINSYDTSSSRSGLYVWEKDFSGEVTYQCTLPAVEAANCILDLGEVRHFAVVYLDGKKIGEVTMPPYRLPLPLQDQPTVLTITVSNTAANACAATEYFDRQNILDVGPYHEKMTLWEQKEPGGGLLGPVRLLTQSFNHQ